ncbi:protein CUSTOS [Channa argus]|uniref:protein CUSTOS n=1 Tax=Channa argus TaxID=215402 RepID=UPI003520678A
MAFFAKMMVENSEDSSSSDDEELKRCQEAVWDTRPNTKEDEDSNVKQSKRVVVADHEYDGNELQVTQGFRTHVAKKLGHLLDSYITETQTEPPSCMESLRCYEDAGFRLFSTSVPGETAEDRPAPVKRRPVSSSSDSDSEMESRLREAAVSIKDLLPSSTQPSTVAPSSIEPPCSEKIKKKNTAAEGGESNVVKKKKKRKPNQEVDSAGSPINTQSNSEQGSSVQEHTQVQINRKKKKKIKGNTEKEAFN